MNTGITSHSSCESHGHHGIWRILAFNCLLVLATAAAASAPAFSQDVVTGAAGAVAGVEASTEDSDGEPLGPADEFNRGVPRSAMEGYLLAANAADYERAAQYLDLQRLPKDQRATQGPQLARRLKIVLDQKLWVDLDALSSDPEGNTNDGLSASRDRVGRIETSEKPVDILLQRVPREDGVLIWKVSSATVGQIPALYEEFGYGVLGELMPTIFFELRILEVQLWQWIGLLLLVFVAYVAAWLVAGLVGRSLGPVLRRTATDVDDRLLAVVGGPLRLIMAVLVFSAGKLTLGLAVPVRHTLSGIEDTLLIIAVAWIILRLLDLITDLVKEYLVRRAQVSATSLLPPGRKTAKVIVVGIAAIALLNSFGFNVTALLAGLGVGGIALALAAQKSLENLFGGITLYVDQPVRVGDFCRFGDKIGTVEDIGLRSTRVRTLDRTVVSIPNAEFANLQLDNFAKRDKIWYHPRIGLRYETSPDQIRYILVEIRKMLYAHPKIDPDPARIRFVGFGAYSLDLDIFAYVKVADYGEFLEVAEDVNLRIMDIVERAGSSFAFPSQTTYIESSAGLNAELVREAEEEVQKWREQNELCLPKFPKERIAELGNTLDYPPKGAAVT